jgi:transketolase
VGEDGGSHQAIEDLALMRAIPHMTVLAPADGVETRKAVMAIAKAQGPVYMRLGRLAVPTLLRPEDDWAVGKAQVLRQGTDVTIVACGMMTAVALAAADALAQEGVETTVINSATIKPLDAATILRAARETGAVVTAEEHSIIGGLGSAVAEVLAEQHPTPLLRVGISDIFGESGTPEALLEKYGLTREALILAVRQVRVKKNHLAGYSGKEK